MKLMIASDIHGLTRYCRELMKAFNNEEPDKLLLLGDLFAGGDDYEETAEMLNDIKSRVLCVRGNCDTEFDQMRLQFPIMAEYCMLSVNDRVIFATHGHHFNKGIMPPLSSGEILLHGHTHVPACENLGDDIYYMNPGSVSLPKHNSKHSYMIFNEDGFFWKDLEGNIYDELK